jgi:hypothetical protein
VLELPESKAYTKLESIRYKINPITSPGEKFSIVPSEDVGAL